MPDDPPFPQRSEAPPRRSEGTGGLRQLPQNIDAEETLLGTILADNSAYDRVPNELKPDHFLVPVNGRVFEAIQSLVGRGKLADPVTLKPFFTRDEALDNIDDYLRRLAEGAMPPSNAEYYGTTIFDMYQRRALVRIGDDIRQNAADPQVEASARDQIEEAEQRLFEVAEHGREATGPAPFQAGLAEALKSAERAFQLKGELSGVTSGLVDLDNLLGGFHASDLIIIAGRTAMGKTALATNIAFRASDPKLKVPWESEEDTRKGVVAVFSLEMAAEQLANRILSEQASIPSDRIRRGKIQDEDLTRLIDVSRDLEHRRLYIDDTPGISIPQLRTRARRLKRTEGGLRMIVVDYLQLMRGTGRHDSRNLEITEISQGLKAIAKELDVPVIALSQLSRQVESREDRRPQLQDLRDSGSIEQDADVVIFVYREMYYLARAEPQKREDEDEEKFQDRHARWRERCEKAHNIATLIVAKQRHGPTGTKDFAFNPELTRFQDLEVRQDPGSVPY